MAEEVSNLILTAKKYSTSSHDKPRLNLGNFVYHKRDNVNNESNLICHENILVDGNAKRCCASITVENANFNVIKISGKKSTITLKKVVETHLHEPLTTMELLADEFTTNLKTRALNEKLPMPQIFQQEEVNIYKKAVEAGIGNEEIALNLNTFHSVKNLMYNSKAERFPTNPQVLDDIEIAENFTLAHDKSKLFFLFFP